MSYQERFVKDYPEKQKLFKISVKRVTRNLINFFLLQQNFGEKNAAVDDEYVEIATLICLKTYPTMSLRQVASDSLLSKKYIHRIITKHLF